MYLEKADEFIGEVSMFLTAHGFLTVVASPNPSRRIALVLDEIRQPESTRLTPNGSGYRKLAYTCHPFSAIRASIRA